MRTGMPGHFNVANALGAFAVGGGAGGRARRRRRRDWPRAARVPGRFEPIDEGQGFAVLVDYAHTPDSLENVLRAARRLTEGRLISVFGAGGDRDRDKRPKMGRAGAELSDLAVVTSDNPRSEDPEAIVAEVAAGAGGRRRGRGRGRPPRRDRPGAGTGRAGRHGRDRRQGPRAGAGVRGRAQDPLRRPRGRPRGAAEAGQPGVRLTAAEIAAALGAEVVAEGGPGVAGPGDDRLRRQRSRRSLLRPARRQPRRRRVRPGGDRGRGLGGGRRLRCAVPLPRIRAQRTANAEGSRPRRGKAAGAWVFAVEDPLAAMQALARAWRRALGARVVGVTGSVGKTSVKDIARALLPGQRPRQPREPQHRDRAAADRARSPRGHRHCWSWRWRCAGPGRSPSWRAIAEPDVAVITNVGPVHVELLGSVEAIAAAKAEVLDALPAGRHRGRAGRGRRAGAAPGAGAARCCASAPAATSRRPRRRWPRASPRR